MEHSFQEEGGRKLKFLTLMQTAFKSVQSAEPSFIKTTEWQMLNSRLKQALFIYPQKDVRTCDKIDKS